MTSARERPELPWRQVRAGRPVLPQRAALYLDRQYVLYGIGLLSTIAPEAALATARHVLAPL